MSKNSVFSTKYNLNAEVSDLSQQIIASRQPRGSRLDPSGTFIQLRGSRNYTPYSLSVTADEMFEDIVARGLRADGLSTKLGIKNNKSIIAGFVSSLFQTDSRHDEAMKHFYHKRQRNNSTKSIFSTMTVDELSIISSELFPSDIEGPLKKASCKSLKQDHDKIQSALEVLESFQSVLKDITANTEFFSSHNFLTRGFFLELVLNTCTFISQLLLVQDANWSKTVEDPVSVQPKKIVRKSSQIKSYTKSHSISAADVKIHHGKKNSQIVNKVQINHHQNQQLSEDYSSKSEKLPDIVNIEFEGNEDFGNKHWIPSEIFDGKTKIMLFKDGKESLSNAGEIQNVMNLQKNFETIIVECDSAPSPEWLLKDNNVDSTTQQNLDHLYNDTAQPGSSTDLMQSDLVLKTSDNILDQSLSLSSSSAHKQGYDTAVSMPNMYLLNHESLQQSSHNEHTLHEDSFIPIEMDTGSLMLHNMSTSQHEVDDKYLHYKRRRCEDKNH